MRRTIRRSWPTEAVAAQAGHKVDGVRPEFPECGGGWLLSDADLWGDTRPRVETHDGGLHGAGGRSPGEAFQQSR